MAQRPGLGFRAASLAPGGWKLAAWNTGQAFRGHGGAQSGRQGAAAALVPRPGKQNWALGPPGGRVARGISPTFETLRCGVGRDLGGQTLTSGQQNTPERLHCSEVVAGSACVGIFPRVPSL